MGEKMTLLPCPFCGSTPFVNVIEAHTHAFAPFMPDHPGSVCIECSCGAGLIDDDLDSVSARWNIRAPPAQTVDVEAVREMIAEMDGYSIGDQMDLTRWADKLLQAIGDKM